MRLRHYISYAALAAATFAAGPAWAQAADAPASPAASEEAPGGEIVVTGTRRTDRTVTESAVPVDVFTADTLATQASGDMNNILRNLVPSFNVGRFAIADGSTFVRPPTLRGLPPDEILVLVNGKRRHRSALVQLGGGSLASGAQGVDLAQIPTVAIERIEVLRDGAAAQYGSDAIAGVINYGLKRNREGIEMNARYGQYYKGDGENYQLSANIGLPLTENGFFNVSGEYLNSKQTSRGGQRPGALLFAQQNPSLAAGVRNPVQIFGDPKVEAGRIFVNGGIEMSDDSEVYFFGNYGAADQEGDFNYRQPSAVTGPDRFGNGNSTVYSAASGIFNTLYLEPIPGRFDSNGRPVYDGVGPSFNFRTIYPSGFTPRFYGRVTDISGTGGYRGKLENGISYDLSASYGQSRIGYRMTNTLNPSMGPDSPTDFYMGRLEQRETNFNGDFAYDWEVGLASPVTIAVGAEHRREAYAIELGDPASYEVGPYAFQTVQRPDGSTFTVTQQVGANGFPGYGPDSTVDNDRKSYAFYLDIETDLTEALTLGGAVRYEHFSDFGSTTNWKGTARYEFSDAIAIRGAASTGFRAPTPGQLFTTNVATGFVGANPVETATLPATHPAARYFHATPLKPEDSTNYSAGIVLTPASSFNVTLDFYQIKVKDRIGISGNFDIDTQEQRDELRARGVANWASLGRVRYFTNAFDTRTRGMDLVANHTTSTDLGRFNTILAVNYNKTKVTDRDPTIIDDLRMGNIQDLNPKWRGNLTENWSMGSWAVMARGSFYGPFTSHALNVDGGDLKVGSEFTFDLEVSYRITDNIRIAAGAENILDNYPDKNFRAAGAPNQNFYTFTGATVSGSRYVDDSPFGFNGGFWYVRAGVNF